jgi:hypothetical protein
MKKSAFMTILIGLIINVAGIGYGLGVPEAAGPGGGPGAGSIITTLLPFLIIIGVIVLMVLAIIRDAKSIKGGGDITLAVIAIVLTILISPVGIILSFVAVKKTNSTKGEN